MSTYSKTYQENHNIDWFATINGRCCHFASGGTYLPEEVNNKEQNRKIQQLVARKNIHRDNDLNGVSRNQYYIDDITSIVHAQFDNEINEALIISISTADAVSAGFYSYCFWGVDKWGGIIYRLIASPVRNIEPEFDEPLIIPDLQNAQPMHPNLQIDADRTIPEYIRVLV